jgi:hypothetical protein
LCARAQIINSYLPSADVTLATCVQNKAVDAIAEKLVASAMPFFVYGNTARLGLLAKEWTLEEQVERDPRVVAIAGCLQRAQSLHTLLREHVLAAVSSRFNAQHARYRQQRADALFGRDDDSDAKQAWLARDPWALWWRWFVIYKRYPRLTIACRELKARIRALATQLEELRARAHAELVSRARAVLCTVATASRSLLSDESVAPAVARITTAVLDEAGTCPETKLPLLLLLPQLQRVIAIGDQKQLQPFSHWKPPHGGGRSGGGRGGGVCNFFNGRPNSCHRGAACKFAHGGGRGGGRGSSAASSPGVGAEPSGFFQRVVAALPSGSVPSLLDQYRMHPRICGFISASFYDGALRTPPEVASARERADAVGLWWVSYPESDAEVKRPGSTSYANHAEVRVALDAARALQRSGRSVLVITFYRGQDVALRRAMEAAGVLERVSSGNADNDSGEDSLRVLTVHQAQGSEADVVILSCVRSNAQRAIGFVSNPNRMNVAISRARERLVVIGDAATLCNDTKWRALRDRCQMVESLYELPPLRATQQQQRPVERSSASVSGITDMLRTMYS